MPEYKAPIREFQYLLNDVFHAPDLWASMPGTAEVTEDLANAILEEGGKLSENELLPLNRSGDEQGCKFGDGKVYTPDGFRDIYKLFAESGWISLGGDPDYGGQGMPKMLTVLFDEMVHSANTSFALYPILTAGACLALGAHGSEELKQRYLPKLYSGEWAGSMCLTEPHCGTDLGMIRTKAETQSDGSYKISGTKVFITGGEHDLTDNIIHLVLAKLPDAPAGPKGISLFLVPKILLNSDDSLGERNPVSCGSIEHKMGIKASATCVMNFDGATGYLVGEVNKGLNAMFTMMNYERLSIGIQGIGLAEVSYQNALAYAKDRRQGRSADSEQRELSQPADSLLVHADVRRMLLTQKANTEASRAFGAFVGMQLDIAKHHPEKEQQQKAEALVALLTPVAKAFCTDKGFESCVLGQQVYGGHGYIREWGMEQFVRDARIAQIYEGTNGIQALDLVARKVLANNADWVSLFKKEINDFLELNHHIELDDFQSPLKNALSLLDRATEWLLNEQKTDLHLANAVCYEYLNLFGLTAFAYMWNRMVIASYQQDDKFHQTKLKTAHFYLQHILPDAQSCYDKVTTGSKTLMQFELDEF